MNTSSRKLETWKWIVNEILAETFKTRDFFIVREFIRDADLDDVEREGILAAVFWESLRNSAWETAEECIAEGYPMDPHESWERGPLHDCLSNLKGRSDVLQWLINHGAKLERRDANGNTPLLSAILNDDKEAIHLLVRRGADVNSSTIIDEDKTPLMTAATIGNAAVVALLLSHGADVNRRGCLFGYDASQYADLAGHHDVAKLIREWCIN